MIWFTGDLHIGHKRVIRYAERRDFLRDPSKGFDDESNLDVDLMNRELVKRWNACVRPDDTIYCLGDFAFCPLGQAIGYAKALNGHKHLVFGNHDKRLRKERTFLELWESTSDYKEIKVEDAEEGQRLIVLCHYAFRVWNKSHHGSWDLYGHSHGSLKDDPHARSMDVGVDSVPGYRPISLPEVAAHMAKKDWKPIDHHRGREE